MNYFEFAYVHLTHGYIYLFANYFIAAGVPLVMGNFGLKPRRKRLIILFAEIAVCIIVMELLAALYFTVFNSDSLVPFVCGALVTAVYAAVRCKNKPAVRVMRSFAYIGLSSLALTLTMSMGSLLGTPYYYLQWILITLNGIIIFSAAFLVRYLSVSEETPCHAVHVVAISVTGGLCYVYAILRRTLQIEPAASIALCLILLFVYIMAYYAMGRIMGKSYEDAYARADEFMRTADRDAFRLSNENLENLHRMRHELKNHYAVMKSFLDGGDYQRLRQYFAEYANKIEDTVGFSDCGNSTLNAIIGIEQGRVRAVGAALVCNIAVPDKINVNDVDLCSLIMNLVNNAVEYYERTADIQEKVIELEVVLINKTLLVKVVNTVLPEHCERALTLKTSKNNKNMHGYGSKIVAAITAKYNGGVNYEASDGKFAVSAMLFCE